MLKNDTKFNFEALKYVGLSYFDLIFIHIQKINMNENIFTKSEYLKILKGSTSLSGKCQKRFFCHFQVQLCIFRAFHYLHDKNITKRYQLKKFKIFKKWA